MAVQNKASKFNQVPFGAGGRAEPWSWRDRQTWATLTRAERNDIRERSLALFLVSGVGWENAWELALSGDRVPPIEVYRCDRTPAEVASLSAILADRETAAEQGDVMNLWRKAARRYGEMLEAGFAFVYRPGNKVPSWSVCGGCGRFYLYGSRSQALRHSVECRPMALTSAIKRVEMLERIADGLSSLAKERGWEFSETPRVGDVGRGQWRVAQGDFALIVYVWYTEASGWLLSSTPTNVPKGVQSEVMALVQAELSSWA